MLLLHTGCCVQICLLEVAMHQLTMSIYGQRCWMLVGILYHCLALLQHTFYCCDAFSAL